MPTVETSVRVEAPPEQVHAVLMDAGLAPEWTTGLERLEVVAGEPGRPGCVGRAHYLEGGRRYVVEDVLEEVRPARYYRSRISGGGLSALVETTLEPIDPDGATLVTIRWTGTGTNAITRLVLSFARRRIGRRAQTDLEKLGHLAESRTTPG